MIMFMTSFYAAPEIFFFHVIIRYGRLMALDLWMTECKEDYIVQGIL